ncbi:MAG: glycine dehydrogenase (aminomethyl-transferring) [Candidatus Nanopelagicales bacterium]|nr:glycine dehydrogenase (aminomethyl-transferring) [Candidatus Nanopelagicales bacterium]
MSSTPEIFRSLKDLHTDELFSRRHIGPDSAALTKMLDVIGYDSLESMTQEVVPAVIRWGAALDLPAAVDERTTLALLSELAAKNSTMVNMIGLGYSDTLTPGVILRNVLENPAWYTAYTPYQPEISQGRLEALLNFQTMIEDLTALPVAGSSLLDEPTAAAEAMTLSLRHGPKGAMRFIVDSDTHPQTLAVLATRAEPLGVELVVCRLDAGLPDGEFNGVLISYPRSSGQVMDPTDLIAAAHARGALAIVAADLLALTVLKAPGEIGADVVVGSAQRFGVPFGFGGPHAGFMSVRAGLERSMPGRLVGVSVDADGAPAYRLALQTREQHIRREKATSNICTAQVLLAVIASMYAVYHGPRGLMNIAERAHRYAAVFADGLKAAGGKVRHESFFDTVTVETPGRAREVLVRAAEQGINIRFIDEDAVSISTDELTRPGDIEGVWRALEVAIRGTGALEVGTIDAGLTDAWMGVPTALMRTTPYLTHPVFNTHHNETSMLRYLRQLADRDIALDRAMIPLGSCTMKLNATTEMEPVTWPEFAGIHPFAPLDQVAGYVELIRDLEAWLVEITGYDAVSLQPNAGSQGELAGLLAIRGYHLSNDDHERDVCLIPSSAHGTNAASAVMAGMRVAVVACGTDGNVELADLRAKIAEHADHLAALMITYPSTHGVFEAEVATICALVHEAGGQVYVDGANLNALVGLAKPGKFGADVSHLNLHKTFCIPHGGGGPGVGPVAVKTHLAPFLPSHPLRPEAGPLGRGDFDGGVGPVSGAPWGSAGILPIPWAYIRMMGPEGLVAATQVAILSANYISKRLESYYPTLYTGANGLVAHECILDLRPITASTGVSVDDVAKRLIDYGFHAPTMSFPVAGTLMVEPTESEDLREIDRFINAMIAIKGEIDAVGAGKWPVDDNPLSNAPHTASCLIGEWSHPYPARLGAYPAGAKVTDKYWPPVRRIDGAYGDRNLVCSCPSLEELAFV